MWEKIYKKNQSKKWRLTNSSKNFDRIRFRGKFFDDGGGSGGVVVVVGI